MPNTSRNPHQSSHDKSREAMDLVQFERATVISAPSHTSGDENKHVVVVKPFGKDVQYPAEVPVSAKGDVHIPTVGTSVYIGYRKATLPIVLDARYNVDDTVPAYEAGERRVGHSLSNAHIFYDSDGNITIENDAGTTVTLNGSDIILNGGTNGAITDVQTSKDADGHVTDVSLTRNENILL